MNFRAIWPAVFSAAFLSVFTCNLATAEDQPAVKDEPKAATATASQEDIALWIQDLDSNSFSARQMAAKKLAEAGKDAIKPLAKAAEGKSVEVTWQALDIMRRHYQSGEAPLKDAAEAALKKLAESDHKAASPRAREIIAPPPVPVAPPSTAVGLGGNGRIILAPGKVIRIDKGVRLIQIQNINGVKTIDFDDNGKKVKIEENNGIKITRTETVNGQEKSETTEAKDLNELKTKNTAAAKDYEKYSQIDGVGNIQIQAQGPGPQTAPAAPGSLPAPAIPAIPAPAPAAPGGS